MTYFDTYYGDSKEALKNALLSNRVFAPNGIVSATQICYYGGDEIENTPQNCIYVDFENMIEYFSSTKYRIPKRIETDNKDFEEKFYQNLQKIEKILNKKKEKLYKEIKNLTPNFLDKKLRVFAYGCRETVLIKYLVSHIIDAFIDLNCETHIYTQVNELYACSEVAYLESLRNFNPHITININHLNNTFLNNSVFNFIWFQDGVEILYNTEKIILRDRDFIYHLVEDFGRLLKLKNIQSTYQNFCINSKIFKNRNEVQREDKKIIFIGTSYRPQFDRIEHKNKEIIFEQLFQMCLKYGYIPHETRRHLVSEFNISEFDFGHMMNYIERDRILIEITKMNLGYDIEIYGSGWDIIKELNPYYKGVVSYGEDISKKYNSAKYGLVIGGYVLQQRTLEIAASGAIPLVFDVRNSGADIDHTGFTESLLFFKNLDELSKILAVAHDLNLNCIVAHNQYTRFANNILDIVKYNVEYVKQNK